MLHGDAGAERAWRYDGEIPFDVAAALGSVRAPVLATINGFTFRTRTMRYGGVYLLGLNREAREGAGVDAGDTVTVALQLDETPREVDVTRELARAFETEPELGSFFDSLSYTHRREYARWISEAKRDETRRRRLERALDLQRPGVKTPDDGDARTVRGGLGGADRGPARPPARSAPRQRRGECRFR